MNLPDKITVNTNNIPFDSLNEAGKTAVVFATTINQLIDYLKEKEELDNPKDDYSQSLNNFMGGDPEENLKNLTIRTQKNDN